MKKNYMLAGVTIICWSTMAPVTKALLSDLSYMGVLFFGSTIAVLFLLTKNIMQKNMRILFNYSIRQIMEQVVFGFVGIFLYTALYYFSLTKLSAQDACIINYLWPIMIIIFSAPILKEKITVRKITAILLSFTGLIIIATKGGFVNPGAGAVGLLDTLTGYFGADAFWGIAAVFTAAVCYGLFSVVNKKADYNQSVAMMIYFGVAAIASGICYIRQGDFAALSVIQIAGVVWLGVFVKGIAYFTWALALRGSDTAKISNLAYLTPFLSVIISAVFLREQIYAYSIIGLLFIIAGIGRMSFTRRGAL
jgi:drug/metabolite transporter (DMT)-like permease